MCPALQAALPRLLFTAPPNINRAAPHDQEIVQVSEPLRVAVVGDGMMARYHALAIRRSPSVATLTDVAASSRSTSTPPRCDTAASRAISEEMRSEEAPVALR